MLHSLRLLEDDVSESMRSRVMGGALDMHAEALRHIFAYFAGVNEAGTALLSKKARMAAETMNVTECHELCEAAGLYTSDEKNEFTIRENLVAFVKVNLDDDLYYQQEEGNTASELVYEEFEEWLVRIFAASVWEALVESGARRPSLLVAVDGDGDGELDDDDIDELFDECDANPSKPSPSPRAWP